MSAEIAVNVDGRDIRVQAGTSVAAAVAIAGSVVFRRSVIGEPRAPLCGMGICFECRVTIDGQQHARSCNRVCEAGMEIRTDDV